MSYIHHHTKIETGGADADIFESLYVQFRKKENRFYSDEEVSKLPAISAEHPHAKEWLLRKKSCERLISYLRKKRKLLTILEVGCGNGWLSAQLARNTPGHVTGLDINREELTQAARVFGDIPNLKFTEGDIRSLPLKEDSFDIILFAASLQYFSFLNGIISAAIELLRPGGEIHIIDTIFYQKDTIEAARERSKDYYKALGFPEAAKWYFHHCMEDLDDFKPTVLYDPSSWRHRFSRNRSPFPWICIEKPVKNEHT